MKYQLWLSGKSPFCETIAADSCIFDFTPAECEEHAEAYAYWAKHRARAAALDEEFSLDEFGYVAGDEAHFLNVQAQLEKRRKKWVASGNTEEERMIKAVLWPYRDTLSDNPRSHLMVDTKTLR